MHEIVKRAALLTLLVWSIPGGATAGVLAFLAAGFLTPSPEAPAAAGGVTLIAVTGTLAALACRGLFRAGGAVRWWLPAYLAATALVLTVAMGAALVLEPAHLADGLTQLARSRLHLQ